MLFLAGYQLLQNIIKSTEVRFPDAVMAQLHPDCIDMCRKLLRRDPGVSYFSLMVESCVVVTECTPALFMLPCGRFGIEMFKERCLSHQRCSNQCNLL